ncbi:MAG: hypothetical protein ACOX6I_06010 [Syntrophomonadaceae bacterium]
MERPAQQRVPRSLFVLIVVILAGMFYYAAVIDKSAPEKVVQDFYQAYFERDFETVASNLSVFWAAQLMPQYSLMSPDQLLENRDEIEATIGNTIRSMEENNTIPDNLSTEIMKDYTKLGENSAIVVYKFMEGDKAAGMEAAILIKEKGQLRIFSLTPISEQNLEQIKTLNIKTLDDNFGKLVTPQSDTKK